MNGWKIWDEPIRQDRAQGGETPVLTILQHFGGKSDSSWPYIVPNRDRRFMMYLAYIHGSRGMMWYTYQGSSYDSLKFPAQWEFMKGLAQEFQDIRPVWLSDRAEETVTVTTTPANQKDPAGNAAIHWCLQTFEGKRYLFAVNAAKVPVQAGFAISGISIESIAEFPSNRVVATSGINTFSDAFEVFGTHVFQITLATPALPVTEGNTAPVLATIGDQILNELTTLTIDLSATDADLPPNSLTYSVVSAPVGVTVNSSTGRLTLTWTPTEAQRPSTNVITVRVTDNGTPPLSDTKMFTVIVNEVNEAPVLADIPDKNVNVGSLLSFVVAATDSDLPANALTYTLEPGAPQGAAIDPVSGAFTWTPTAAQAGTTNGISIRITDNGVPPLSDSKAFTVVVAALASVPVQLSVSLLANGDVRLVWTTTPGRTYTLQRSADLADWQDLTTLNATSDSLEHTDGAVSAAPARFYRVVQR